MVTAARSTADYTTLYMHVLEDVVNGMETQDLVFENTPLLSALQAIKEERALGEASLVRVLESKEDDVDSFDGYDTVGTAPVKGAQGMRFTHANYSAPITVSWTEKMEYTSDDAIADGLGGKAAKQLGKMGERLAVDAYRGNTDLSTNIVGLEQMIPDYVHDQTSGSAATNANQPLENRFQTRQCGSTPTYGGITRTAWTDDDNPGTYHNANAVQFGLTGADGLGFDTNGQPTEEQKRWDEAYQIATWGSESPDMIASSLKYFRQYMSGGQQQTRVTRTGGSGGTLDLSFPSVSYMGAVWFVDFLCKTYTAHSAATVGGANAYMLNSKYLHWRVDERANGGLDPEGPRMPTNQHAFVQFLLWRGQFFTESPRHQLRIFE